MSSSRSMKWKPWFFSNSESSWYICCKMSWLKRAQITHSVDKTAAKSVVLRPLYPPVIPHFDQPGLFLDTDTHGRIQTAGRLMKVVFNDQSLTHLCGRRTMKLADLHWETEFQQDKIVSALLVCSLQSESLSPGQHAGQTNKLMGLDS